MHLHPRFVTALSALAAVLAYAPGVAHAQTTAPTVYVAAYGGLTMPKSDTFETAKTVPDGDGTTAYKATYGTPRSAIFDIGGGVVLAGKYTAGVSVSHNSSSEKGTASITFNHPAYHPTISASTGTEPLERSENTVHLSLGYQVPMKGRVDLHLFGGPSRVSLSQELVSDLYAGERFSSSTRTWSAYIDRYEMAAAKGSAWGYHAGVDAGIRLSSRVSLRGMLRYTGASVDVEEPVLSLIEERPVMTSLKAGGTQALVGLRIGL